MLKLKSIIDCFATAVLTHRHCFVTVLHAGFWYTGIDCRDRWVEWLRLADCLSLCQCIHQGICQGLCWGICWVHVSHLLLVHLSEYLLSLNMIVKIQFMFCLSPVCFPGHSPMDPMLLHWHCAIPKYYFNLKKILNTFVLYFIIDFCCDNYK